jgi:CheY-like chemotaxis protein
MVSPAAKAASNSKFVPILGPDGGRPRLLLAEDSKAARVLTAALLSRMGCDVDAVEHGQDAVEYAQDGRYDLIMLDIEMPVLDGVAAAQQIRAMGGEAGRTPLMALSAFLADSAKSDSWRNTFDHAIPKPAGRDELRAAIQAILDARPPVVAVATAAAGIAEHGPEPVVDWEVASEMQAHLPRDQWLEIVMTAETEIMACLSAMRTDYITPGRRAHKIKGIAASFGLARLAAAARRLEGCGAADIRLLRSEADRMMALAVQSTDQLRTHCGLNRALRYG